MAKAFQKLAKEGAASFYSGSLSKDIIHDLSTGFGKNIITEDDLFNYRCGGVKMSWCCRKLCPQSGVRNFCLLKHKYLLVCSCVCMAGSLLLLEL